MDLINKGKMIDYLETLESNRQQGERLNHETLLILIRSHVEKMPSESPQEDKPDKRCGTCRLHYTNNCNKDGGVAKKEVVNCRSWKAKEDKPEVEYADDYTHYLNDRIKFMVTMANRYRTMAKHNLVKSKLEEMKALIYTRRIYINWKETGKIDYQEEENPKENRSGFNPGDRVWICDNCGKDIFYATHHYYHLETHDIICQFSPYDDHDHIAIPNPDSERVIN